MKVALAQLNSMVGDMRGNAQRILNAVRAARDRGADLVLTPEMSLTGCPLDDLVYRPALHQQVQAALHHIQSRVGAVVVAVGHPLQERGRLYNACSLLQDGRCLLRYRKRRLPNYGVFDEQRHFRPGRRAGWLDLAGVRIGLTLCEDIWHPAPARHLQRAGVQLLINLSASPFHIDVQEQRLQVLHRRVAETGLPLLYVNQVGGQDEQVFDGGSMALDHCGTLQLQAPQFVEGNYMLEYDQERLLALHDPPLAAPLLPEARIWQALCTALHDYVEKNQLPGVVLGLSGGIDSAVTACLAVDALGAGRVQALSMPSVHTAAMSVEDAGQLAQGLGITLRHIPIDPLYNAFTHALMPTLGDPSGTLTGENLQARCRGVLLMAQANHAGLLLLCTGNKSELATGYTTLYGDAAGGYAPLKDVYKTDVYALARWRNRSGAPIPARTLTRPPSAELAPGQRDQDSLPPYAELDTILKGLLEADRSPAELAREGIHATTALQVLERVHRSEHKRRQTAPGPRITRRSLGRDRRYPICSAYQES